MTSSESYTGVAYLLPCEFNFAAEAMAHAADEAFADPQLLLNLPAGR